VANRLPAGLGEHRSAVVKKPPGGQVRRVGLACEGLRVVEETRVAGSAALSLVTAATPLRPEPGLFEAMLAGWRRQQQSRRLGESIIGLRERTVRRFSEFTGGWPWEWNPAQLESWVGAGGWWAHSTVRAYQGALAGFLDYVCDPRYGWVAECEQQLGGRDRCRSTTRATPRCNVADYEGRPGRPSHTDDLTCPPRRGGLFVPNADAAAARVLARAMPPYGARAARSCCRVSGSASTTVALRYIHRAAPTP